MEDGGVYGIDAVFDMFDSPRLKSGWFWCIFAAIVAIVTLMILLLVNSYGCINSAKVICTSDKATKTDKCSTFDYATYDIRSVGGVLDSRVIVTEKQNPSNVLSILQDDIVSNISVCLDP